MIGMHFLDLLDLNMYVSNSKGVFGCVIQNFLRNQKMNFKLAEFKAADVHFPYLDKVVKELH